MPLADVARLLEGAGVPWWFCGGHALELFLGSRPARDGARDGSDRRPHADVDVGILRRDQSAVHARLEGFELHIARDGRLRELGEEERREGLSDPACHALWCRRRGATRFGFEILLNEGDREELVFRRDARIRRPMAEAVLQSREGWPYLAPELQLLFKAKALRARDEDDFRVVLPALDESQRCWLRRALASVHPAHPWLERIPAGIL